MGRTGETVEGQRTGDIHGGRVLEEFLEQILWDEAACAGNRIVGVIPRAVWVWIAGYVEEVALLKGEVLGPVRGGGGDGTDDLLRGEGGGGGLCGGGEGDGGGYLEAGTRVAGLAE